jgi:hypothetical protein
MNSHSCSVCLEEYRRDINPPMTCNPCGHTICKPCITQWLRSNSTCPECRNNVSSTTINRGVLDLIDHSNGLYPNLPQPSAPPPPSNTNLIQFYHSNNKQNETILDKSLYAIYVIDNSLSMTEGDGKIFMEETNGIIRKKLGVWRWEEAVYKTSKIADYNVKRRMKSAYYLLNPYNKTWEENEDYVVVDPNELDYRDKLAILKDKILDTQNIRRNTPLDEITEYFITSLQSFINMEHYNQIPVCYNILTDGNPNCKLRFEHRLKNLCKNYNIFLVINLCTDDEDIIDYYNNLDKTIGNELSGMDVIDDLETEQIEVIENGNTFITYSNDIHICRMAGCYSVISDLLDEEPLNLFYMNKLCKELVGSPKDLPHWEDRVGYIQKLESLNKKVYNLQKERFMPLINTSRIDWAIWTYQLKNKYEKIWKVNYVTIIIFLMVFSILFINWIL